VYCRVGRLACQWHGAGFSTGETCKIGGRRLLAPVACFACCLRMGHIEMRDVLSRISRLTVGLCLSVGCTSDAQYSTVGQLPVKLEACSESQRAQRLLVGT
jgi:hypothetical protein